MGKGQSGVSMKRRTKTKRLQMIVDEYNRRHPGPFKMDDVVDWAIGERLLPAPAQLTMEIEAAAEYDKRFEYVRETK